MRGQWYFVTLMVILLLFISQPQHNAAAQDGGPECPPGFVWDRLSGVGCVQENCLGIPNAQFSYTQSCICSQGYQACTVPVDISGVACDPFCPAAELVACVPAGQPCPSQPGADGAGSDSEFDDFLDELFPDTASSPDPNQEQEINDLVRDLENFLAGQQGADPTLGRAAAGTAAVTTLLTTWVISQLLAGGDRGKILEAIARWRQRTKTSGAPRTDAEKPAKEPASEPDKTDLKSAAVETSRTDGARTDSPADADAPPDLPTLRRLRLKEKAEAQERIKALKELQVLLDAEYRRVFADWEVARRCAAVDGVIDIADIWMGLRGKLNTSTVRGAYGKDLLKQAIKGAFRKIVRYRVDGTFEISPGKMLEGAHSGLGVNPYHPGGALKQMLQNLVSGKGVLGFATSQKEFFKTHGTKISEFYGPAESYISVASNAWKEKNTCEGLREQLNELRTVFNKTNNYLETAQMDYEVADSALKSIDQDIKELKENFPNRFQDL